MTGPVPAAPGRVPALGGERTVPAPDPIAREYLRLALRLDQHDAGLVDGYFGPADLKAEVDLEPRRPLAALRDDATALRARLDRDVGPDRAAFLDGQLVALETRAAVLGGETYDYLDEVERLYAWRPSARPEAVFDTAAAAIDAVLPGPGALDERLTAFDATVTVPPDRVASVVERLTAELRRHAASRFGVPAGESVRLGFVSGQPWSAYDWYDGGLRSRVDIDIDLPIRAPELLDVLAHETYAGHHLEHAWKEAELVEAAGCLEHSVLLLLTPECLISEGLADLGPSLLLPDPVRSDLLAAVVIATGLGGDARARELASTAVALRPHRRRLGELRVNAAIGRWADGRSSAETLAYLIEVGRMPEARARKALEFLEHPRWRTYVHVYHEGEPILRRWVDAAPDGDPDGRFRRLLREPLTPSRIIADLEDGPGPSGSDGRRPSKGDQSSRTNATRSSPSSS
jgi:hypothetical protein